MWCWPVQVCAASPGMSNGSQPMCRSKTNCQRGLFKSRSPWATLDATELAIAYGIGLLPHRTALARQA